MSVMLAVTVFTAIVVARGVGGHLDRSLSGWSVFAVYLGMTFIAGGACWWRLCLDREPVRSAPLGYLLIAYICPLVTAIVLGRDFSAGALTLLWLLSFAIVGAHVWLVARGPTLLVPGNAKPASQVNQPAAPPETAVSTKREQKEAAAETQTATFVSEPSPNPDEETFSQRWTRREGDMGDELEGTLRIYFAVGQRTATADIPIVPAMASIPDVDCEPMDPANADVQVVVRGVHTYGVRLELQRPAHRDAAEEIEVAVLIHAERSEKFEV